MKKTMLILCIVFAAGGAFAQQHNLIGERSVYSPFDTFEEKTATDEVGDVITKKKEKATTSQATNKSQNVLNNKQSTESTAEHLEMIGSRSYSSTGDLFVAQEDADGATKDRTLARHEMIGERGISSVTAVYAQTNAPRVAPDTNTATNNTAGTNALANNNAANANVATTTDNATNATTTTDNATNATITADNATNATITTDNATNATITADNATNATLTVDNATSSKSWLKGLFDTEKTDQKFWAAINFNWVSPQSSDISGYLKTSFGLNAGYIINEYFGVELGFRTMNGKTSSQWVDAGGGLASVESKIDMYDISAMATARYTFKLWKGDVMPYIGAGAGFVSATKKDTNFLNGLPTDNNHSKTGYSFSGRAGVRYGVGMFILGANVQYTYSRLSFEKEYDFSSISYGLEAGLRF